MERDRGRRWRGRTDPGRRAYAARIVGVDLHRQRPRRPRHRATRPAVRARVAGGPQAPHVRPRRRRHRHRRPDRARVRDRQGAVIRLGLGAHDRADRGRIGATCGVRRDRGTERRSADPAQRLPRQDADGRRRRAAARCLGSVRDVLLRLAVRAGDPRLQPTEGRTGVPAGDRWHHRRRRYRPAVGQARGRSQRGADRNRAGNDRTGGAVPGAGARDLRRESASRACCR